MINTRAYTIPMFIAIFAGLPALNLIIGTYKLRYIELFLVYFNICRGCRLLSRVYDSRPLAPGVVNIRVAVYSESGVRGLFLKHSTMVSTRKTLPSNRRDRVLLLCWLYFYKDFLRFARQSFAIK